MSKAQELLDELVRLKRDEMRRTKRYRTFHFVLITLPSLVFIISILYMGWTLFNDLHTLLENFPSLAGEILDAQQSNFFDNIKSQL